MGLCSGGFYQTGKSTLVTRLQHLCLQSGRLKLGIRAVCAGSKGEGDGPAGTTGSQTRPSVSAGLVRPACLQELFWCRTTFQNSEALPGLKSLWKRALWGWAAPRSWQPLAWPDHPGGFLLASLTALPWTLPPVQDGFHLY